MYLKLLDRARSYLSGGARSDVLKSQGLEYRSNMIKQIDRESDAKINAMNNVDLIKLLERVLAATLDRSTK